MALRVGFIGLGDIGKPMAKQLLPAGFETTVFDLDEARVKELVEGGARAASSPREVGEAADVLCLCVPADAHVEAVLTGADGALEGLAPGSVVAIHSTVLPETMLWAADEARPQGVAVVEAAVTSGFMAAAEGRGTFLLEGRELPMEPGVMLVAPEGVPHGIRNDGGERLVVTAILAPGPGKR